MGVGIQCGVFDGAESIFWVHFGCHEVFRPMPLRASRSPQGHLGPARFSASMWEWVYGVGFLRVMNQYFGYILDFSGF